MRSCWKLNYIIFGFIFLLFYTAQCQDTGNKNSFDEVIIKFKESADSASIDLLCKEIGLIQIKRIPKLNASVYKISSDLTVEHVINKCKSSNIIEYIEPNYKVNINQ